VTTIENDPQTTPDDTTTGDPAVPVTPPAEPGPYKPNPWQE
jgi:hypothetical protein